MIAKLNGKISGKDITFYKEGDSWRAVVPKDLSGEYVVELWAIDEAGNIGHAAKWLFTVDPTTLCVHLEPIKFFTQYVGVNFYVDGAIENYAAEVIYPRCKGVI